ncbi:hypothetical protein D9613_008084 [Agrocybe pediades]|uniref:Uncharacterized protein n=1 Tax=Agrocybe pediades TaxID=84607 RepID=A0A8H4QN42_9AGAR|nr:hypothetical protein D9613_008084 [Agrocybe pediades]
MRGKLISQGIAFQERTNTLPISISNNFGMEFMSMPPSTALPTYHYSLEDVRLVGPAVRSVTKPISAAQRYKSAEDNLSESLWICQRQSRSTHELEVEALKNGISFLDAQVADSRAQVENLRQLLADRTAVEPETYKEMQRRRWMEERRHQSVENLSKFLQQHLASPVPSRDTANSYSKSNANLALFFEVSSSSLPRPMKHSRSRCRAPAPSSQKIISSEEQDDAKRRPRHGIVPLKLTVPQYSPSFLQPLKVPVTNPLPGPKPVVTSSTPLSPPLSDQLRLSLIEEHSDSETTTTTIPSTRNSTLFSDEGLSGNGTALIWRDIVPPLRPEGIMYDLVVPMPDYALDLLSTFDSDSSTSISPQILSLTTTFSTTLTPDTPASKSSPSGYHSSTPKSPSRKRISALFSVPEALSSRKGLGAGMTNDSTRQQATHKSSKAPVLPVIKLVSEDEDDNGDGSKLPGPVSVSFSSNINVHDSSTTASTSSSAPTAPNHSNPMSRLRKRMSVLIRHNH